MIYVITSECMSCGVCVEVCPVSAIVEVEDQYIITNSCVDCGKCQQSCPIDAIRIIKRKD